MPADGPSAVWLRNAFPRPAAAARLVCMPHAGGSAGFYRAWPQLLPAEIDFHAVQYPGREDRFTEAPAGTMEELADRVTEAVRPLFDKHVDVVLFGHSMGASLAYEVARRCESEGNTPALLLVSARTAPHLLPAGPVRYSTDEEVVDDVRRMSPTGTTPLDDPELWELLLPMVRADFRLVEAYRPVKTPVLAAPIAALRGREDDRVDERGAQGWATLTRAGFTHRVFDGGHFYLQQHERTVVDTVSHMVGAALRRPTAPMGHGRS